ncbi:hypothetical protein [Methylobacterium bullatum]|uniref:Uncharacterized protein n=1 Tax=Methylobacterium bullatum TaxID=570505 RepID=A0A679JHJ1_9HYPH|nr:hypothetical protein MBLL_00380 [Methylobacterium bullatum]
MQTVFPREAIEKANSATAKFQLSQDTNPDRAVADYINEIQPVLTELGPKADGYIREVRGAIKMKLHVTAMPEAILPDKLTDPLNRKAVAFLQALLDAFPNDGTAKAA